MRRRFAERRDALVVAGLLALSALLYLALHQDRPGGTAVVSIGGERHLTIRYSELQKTEYYDIPSDPSLVIEADREGVRVSEAHCPDQRCVKMGKLTRGGGAITCLPARVVVSIEGKEGPDAVAS